MTREWLRAGAAFAVFVWVIWDNYRLEIENQELREELRIISYADLELELLGEERLRWPVDLAMLALAMHREAA